jgi:tetratricopeptide (TPR) repeat protein
LFRLRGEKTEAEAACAEANARAVELGQKEISVQASIELGLAYLEMESLKKAEQVLLQTRREASQVGLMAFEAEAAAVLAEVYLADGDFKGAFEIAQKAIEMAEGFSGLPLLLKARAALGEACEKLGQTEESVQSHVKVAETLEQIGRGLMDEHLAPYMNRPDVKAALKRSLSALESAGAPEADMIQKWMLASNSRP